MWYGDATGRRGNLANELDIRPAPLAVAPASAVDLGLRIDPDIAVPVGSWALATAFGVVLFAALTGRPGKREDGSLVPAASIAVASAVSIATQPNPGGPAEVSSAADRRIAKSDSLDPDEANLPRWLRPTLREQRRSSHRP